ncbi:hypothetical protein GCM10010206_77740 [Streptomyces cinerochromogenes]|nr:hypothetical protein GCM10010206_77740 [Streptomyces cinerochromogenes]
MLPERKAELPAACAAEAGACTARSTPVAATAVATRDLFRRDLCTGSLTGSGGETRSAARLTGTARSASRVAGGRARGRVGTAEDADSPQAQGKDTGVVEG